MFMFVVFVFVVCVVELLFQEIETLEADGASNSMRAS